MPPAAASLRPSSCSIRRNTGQPSPTSASASSRGRIRAAPAQQLREPAQPQPLQGATTLCVACSRVAAAVACRSCGLRACPLRKYLSASKRAPARPPRGPWRSPGRRRRGRNDRGGPRTGGRIRSSRPHRRWARWATEPRRRFPRSWRESDSRRRPPGCAPRSPGRTATSPLGSASCRSRAGSRARAGRPALDDLVIEAVEDHLAHVRGGQDAALDGQVVARRRLHDFGCTLQELRCGQRAEVARGPVPDDGGVVRTRLIRQRLRWRTDPIRATSPAALSTSSATRRNHRYRSRRNR